jgi:hypothetical protein
VVKQKSAFLGDGAPRIYCTSMNDTSSPIATDFDRTSEVIDMARLARIHLVPLRSSLVNLPISIYGPLLERSVRPQSLAVHLKTTADVSHSTSTYVGWTGMASASSLAHFSSSNSSANTHETIEIDPQYAQALGFSQGDVVELGLIYDMPIAVMVVAEPVGPDDWEIIVRVPIAHALYFWHSLM